MGADEMRVDKNLNKSTVKKHLDMIYFYYGSSDKWCPIDYYHDMKKFLNEYDQSEINLHLDEMGLDHAFVIFKKQCEILTNIVHNHLNSE